MRLPFTTNDFFEVFRQYNETVWPLQIVLLGMAIMAFALTYTRWNWRSRAVAWILAFFWIWTGAVYHFAHFAAINPAARLFAALCVVQGVVFAWWGARSERLLFDRPSQVRGAVAWSLVLYSLVVYPILSWTSGHGYMGSPTFGAPCPTTIFSFGLLWLVRPPAPWYTLIVPIIWSAIGGSAAFALGVRQDIGLIVAGLFGLWLLIVNRRGPVQPGGSA